MSTATAQSAQPATPQRGSRGTPPTSAGNRSSTSARPSSSRVKSAGKSRDGGAKRVVEDVGRDSPWDDAVPVGPPATWAFLSQDDMKELDAIESNEGIVLKFAQVLGLADTHKRDLNAGIRVMFNVGNYLFAKENTFTLTETGAFCAILKNMLDKEADRPLSLEKAVAHFRDTLLAHAAPSGAAGDGGLNGWEVFRPEVVIKIMDFTVTTIFQHFRLYQHVLSTTQEDETHSQVLHLEEPPFIAMPIRQSRPFSSSHSNSSPSLNGGSRKSSGNRSVRPTQMVWPPPLAQHLPLAVYEAQKEEEKQRERERVAAEEAIREAERKAAENPFEVLDNETVKMVATEAVAGLLGGVQREVEARLDDIRIRFLEKLASAK
ncbi:flagellar C1a complex subunit C1a-32-domain-containing protein [Geranomyces variabilis]|nr:flagellar C1a complex subunit C1a-32-domain-containing protein [Geranomyces variabilis]KAJ3134597.1 hypothetical protein HDU90_004929 [Geranomyces variabilis]